MSRDARTPEELRRQADHIWHVWMNKYATAESEAGRQRPHSLYEFKDLLSFLEWGWKRLQDAFTGKLPQVHKQCSMSDAELIQTNCLKCVLGVDVTKCEILISIQSAFVEERNRECGQLGKYYESVPDDEMYRRMANTCAWHIYKGVTQGTEGFNGIDTSEGHLLDVGDRMFWNRVYASMSADDPDDEE